MSEDITRQWIRISFANAMSVGFVVAIAAAYFVAHLCSGSLQELVKDSCEPFTVDWLPRGLAQDRFWFTLVGAAYGGSVVMLVRGAGRVRTLSDAVAFLVRHWYGLLIVLAWSIASCWLFIEAWRE